MAISEALQVFLEDYVWLRGLSKLTGEGYAIATKSFIRSVGDISIEELSLEHIKKWRRDMEADHHDSNGMSNYMYRLKSVIKWMKRRYNLSIDLEDLVIPRKIQRLPNYFQPEDVGTLIAAVPEGRSPHTAARDRAIIALLYSSGVRVGEMQQIRLRDVMGDEIKIKGKGNKERIAFIDRRAQNLISEYLVIRPHKSEHLFVSHSNKPLTRASYQQIVAKAAERAGFSQTISPHVFRHSMATQLLRSGCNLRYIQEILGHAQISTTQIYTHVARDDLKSIYKQFHN